MARNPANTGRRLSVEAPRLAELQQAIDRFPGELRHVAETEIGLTLGRIKDRMVARSSGSPLARRAGRMARAWSTKPNGTGGQVVVNRAVGNYGLVAYKHEFGFVERGTPWIWIPTDRNLKANLAAPIITAAQAREKIAAGTWRYSRRATGHPDLELKNQARIVGLGARAEPIRATRPALVLNENDVPMFLLVREITIPPRLQFFDTGTEAQGPLLQRLGDLAVAYWSG